MSLLLKTCPLVGSSVPALLPTVLRGVAACHVVYLFGLNVPPNFESSILPQQTLLSARYICWCCQCLCSQQPEPVEKLATEPLALLLNEV